MLPPNESLLHLVHVAFAWSIMDIRGVVYKTGSA